MMVRTNPPRMDTAATRAMFRAMRKNAFLADVQKFVEKIAVCKKEGGERIQEKRKRRTLVVSVMSAVSICSGINTPWAFQLNS